MALYQYKCRRCRRVFDRFSDVDQRDEPKRCPKGHLTSRRLITRPAITQPDPRKTFRQAMRTQGLHFTANSPIGESHVRKAKVAP